MSNTTTTAARKPRSPEYIERKRVREAERRRVGREAKGFASAEEMRKFAVEKARQIRAARLAVIQPSIAKRQTMQAANKAGETVEQFMARGGRVDVLLGFAHKPGPLPARHFPKAGLL